MGRLFGLDRARAQASARARCSSASASAAPATAAAAQVLEGHAAAARHRAGADQRSRAGRARRADERASIRSAARRSAISSSSCSARARRCSSRRTSSPTSSCICDRVAIVVGGTLRDVGPLEQLLSPRLLAHRGRASSTSGDNEAQRLPPDADVDAALREALAAGKKVVSVTPRRESLEDLFVREVDAGDVGGGAERVKPQGAVA